MADKGKIDKELADAGWEPDGTFSEHLVIGESDDDLYILVHRRPWDPWKTDEPAYELYDVGRHASYWVREVPTPKQASMLLEEHGPPPRGVISSSTIVVG